MFHRTLLSLLFAAVVIAPVHAWNAVGHMAVGKLAYDQMSEGEQLKLFTLLKKHPHYAQFLAASKPDDVSEAEWAIMRSAVWSDWIRPRRKDNRGTNATKYSRGEDHYVNIPLIAPGSEEFFAGKTLVDPDLPNILTALKSRCNDIKTKTAADEDKAVAACWVFHLIGDIHQPMHNVAYFSSESIQTGDQGGNKFAVREGSKSWKLHAYWDDLLGIDSDYGDDSAAHQAELYRMSLKVAERLRGLELTADDKGLLEKNTTFDRWSMESYDLARSVAYAKGDGRAMLKAVEAPFNGRVPEGAAELDEAYVKRAKETADKRIVFAGKRLADRMKMLLKP